MLNPTDREMPIVVAGAGPGGLTAALALSRVGFPVRVVERHPELRADGAGLTLQVNAMRMLEAIGVEDAVAGAGARILGAEIRSARGRVLSRLDLVRAGEGLGISVGIHRAALAKTLASELAPDRFEFGVSIEGFEEDAEGVDVLLGDGRTLRASLLVGADGLHSRVRRALVGEHPVRYSGYTCWRGVAAMSDPLGQGRSAEIWGRGHRFGFVPLDPATTYWFATANHPPGEDRGRAGEDLHQEVRDHFGEFADPVGDLIEATPASKVLRNDISDLAPLERWTSGRVALLGDAAHATTPNMGQGACLAIEDAVVLAAHLKDTPDVAAALRAYEAERRPRAQKIVARSRRFGQLGQLEFGPARALRDLAASWVPGSWTERSMRELWGVSIPAL